MKLSRCELARLDLKSGKTAGKVDPCTMAIAKTGAGAGVITLAWEETEYSIAFTNKK
jgi:hypothetical protein